MYIQLNKPMKLSMAPTQCELYDHAHLLILADCSGYTYASIYNTYMEDKVILIACPYLDTVDYKEIITDILRNNDIDSIDVVRMKDDCCRGIVHSCMQALQDSQKDIPWAIITLNGFH